MTSASTVEAALAALEREPFDLAFLDLRLGDQDGMALLPRLLAARPGLAVVVITAYATIDTAVQAIKLGAVDYIPKPFTPAQIRLVVEQTLARRDDRDAASRDLEAPLAEELPGDRHGDARRRGCARRSSSRPAPRRRDAPILLRGENGTGKSVLARFIHAAVAARREAVRDRELPDAVRGAARQRAVRPRQRRVHRRRARPGRAGRGGRGRHAVPRRDRRDHAALQAKLLRFLQDKQFERVGETRTRRADVRVVAATNRDLDAEVAAGRFREDLLFRLNVIEIVVPPLRERREDILPLAHRFLQFFAQRRGAAGARR